MPKGVYVRQIETRECQNGRCRRPFAAVKGRQALWCSWACKQAGYRLRRWKRQQEAHHDAV